VDQGHNKKRHLHTDRIVFFMDNFEAKRRSHLLREDYCRIQKEAKEGLDALINSEKTKGITVKELIREVEPTEEILKVVKNENIDFIGMLGHEEGRLEHFLLGAIKRSAHSEYAVFTCHYKERA